MQSCALTASAARIRAPAFPRPRSRVIARTGDHERGESGRFEGRSAQGQGGIGGSWQGTGNNAATRAPARSSLPPPVAASSDSAKSHPAAGALPARDPGCRSPRFGAGRRRRRGPAGSLPKEAGRDRAASWPPVARLDGLIGGLRPPRRLSGRRERGVPQGLAGKPRRSRGGALSAQYPVPMRRLTHGSRLP